MIETTLTQQIEARGGTLERGRRIVGFQQDGDGVTVEIVGVDEDENPSGEPERVRCRYLVGADGGAGFVRRELGLDFEPETLPNCMNRQLDAKLSWRRSTDHDHLWFFYDPRGFCGVLPVWGGYHRLFFLADDTGIPDRDPTLEEMQAIAREVTEDETLTLTDPIWLTHSRFQHGVSPHYRKDRVFLVGDAGHLTLPAGGQGMNAGFHDAVGLSWRLATVLQGRAEPVLLDSYDTERGGEHRRLDKQQMQGFQNSVYRGRLKDAAVNVAAAVRPDIGALLQGTDDLQQLSVAYPTSPLNEDAFGMLHGLWHCDAPKPGERAPDAPVIAADGASTTLFAHIDNPDGRTFGWSLLLFDGRQADALSTIRDAIDAVGGWDWVRPRLVLGAAIAEGGMRLRSPTSTGRPMPPTASDLRPRWCSCDRTGISRSAARPSGRTPSRPIARSSSDRRAPDRDGLRTGGFQTGAMKNRTLNPLRGVPRTR